MKDEKYIKDLNWDFIIDKIKEEQCLLVLGSGVFIDDNGITNKDKLIKYLDPDNNFNIQRFYQNDEFFLFDDLSKQTLVCHEIKTFYNQTQPNELLRLIAEIPFHIVLSVTPDKLLNKVFEEMNFGYQFGYYKKNKDPQSIRVPTKRNPLIYNLFGCLDNEESLILTYDDLYDYFKSIFARKSMPQQLKDQLHKIRNIIFLGVPFDKWYMQLLLRELEIHNRGYSFLRFAANQSISSEIKSFCTEQFRINFISNNIESKKNVILQFVNKLHECFKMKDGLRKQKSREVTITGMIKKCVADADIGQAIRLLEAHSKATSLEDEVIKLKGRYRNFTRRSQNNLLRSEEKDFQNAIIVENIIEIANQITV